MARGSKNHRRLKSSSHQDEANPKELRERLLRGLAYEESLLNDDCKSILNIRNGSGSGLDAERVAFMQNNSQLQAWMSLNRSSILLVDGGCAVSSSYEISYATAQMVEYALQQSNRLQNSSEYDSGVFILPLAFFCSQHRNRRRDNLARPRGLAKMLLAQLIDQFRGFNAKELQACQKELEVEDLEGVCLAIRKLVKRLPATSIVILVIEGIDILMGEKTRDGLRHLVRSLVETHEGRHAAILKFLFTSTTSSEPVRDLFEEGDVLRIPRVINSTGSYRNLVWKDSENLGSFGME